MLVFGRKVQHVAGSRDHDLSIDGEANLSFDDECDLLVRVTVDVGNDERVERESTDHHVLTDHHLAFYPVSNLFDRNLVPIGNECVSLNFTTQHMIAISVPGTGSPT